MSWNGSGTFNRDYNWQADRDASIKILASRMDGEFANYKGGLQNCITRDNQTPPTADISWGSHKLTSLAAGTVSTDGVNLGQVGTLITAAANEWQPYSAAVVAWVSATQFKVTGIDATATFSVGRRVKITHNTGGTVSYATITVSAFVTDTTVTVAVDGGVALVSTVTAVALGLLSYANSPYLDPRTLVLTGSSTGAQAYTAAAAATVQLNADTGVQMNDSNGEFNTGTFTWTCRYPGIYMVATTLVFQQTGAGIADAALTLIKNGGFYWFIGADKTSRSAGNGTWINKCSLIKLVATDTLLIQASAALNGSILMASNQPNETSLCIARIA